MLEKIDKLIRLLSRSVSCTKSRGCTLSGSESCPEVRGYILSWTESCREARGCILSGSESCREARGCILSGSESNPECRGCSLSGSESGRERLGYSLSGSASVRRRADIIMVRHIVHIPVNSVSRAKKWQNSCIFAAAGWSIRHAQKALSTTKISISPQSAKELLRYFCNFLQDGQKYHARWHKKAPGGGRYGAGRAGG